MRLLLTAEMRGAHAGRLAEFESTVELVELASGTDPVSLDLAFFSSDCYPDRMAEFMGVVLKAENMRWLHSFSAGVDHPIFTTLKDQGMRVTTSSGAAARPIAEAVVMHLLALCRQLPKSIQNQSNQQWVRIEGRDLAGSTTVVLGFGPIGRAVADLLGGFGSRVIVIRRQAVGDEPCETWPMSRLHEALGLADQVVLALPSNPDTIGILDEVALGVLNPHALLVNIGRGELIEEVALVEALEGGRLGGAALDVFETEPLPESNLLWSLPNVIITAHNSALTPANRAAVVDIFFDNLRRYVNSEPLVNEI